MENNTVQGGKFVVEVRPEILECDVVRFQNNKEKWVAFVGLLDGHPYGFSPVCKMMRKA